jgi:hypothetical protein
VGIGPTLFGHLVQCGIGVAENAGPENDGPKWILIDLNISDNSPCGSEVGHQISKESVEQFKSYRNLKKSKMAAGLSPPSWILVNLNISGNSPCWSKVGHQISKESVERFKSYRNLKKSKMAYGRHLGFCKFEHFG